MVTLTFSIKTNTKATSYQRKSVRLEIAANSKKKVVRDN